MFGQCLVIRKGATIEVLLFSMLVLIRCLTNDHTVYSLERAVCLYVGHMFGECGMVHSVLSGFVHTVGQL